MKENIICAAIHYDDGNEYVFQKCYGVKTGFVIGVFRHPYASDILPLNPKYKRSPEKESDVLGICVEDYKVRQGFITSLGRFVGRKEALQIAKDCGQIVNGDCESIGLFSEDLYPKQMYNNLGESIE